MLTWIAWKGIVLTSKLRTYAKLNCLKWNCFLILKLYLQKTELFEIELFWHLTVGKQKQYLY